MKNYKIDEYLNNCTCMKSIFDLVITCEDEAVNTSTNSFNKKAISGPILNIYWVRLSHPI